MCDSYSIRSYHDGADKKKKKRKTRKSRASDLTRQRRQEDTIIFRKILTLIFLFVFCMAPITVASILSVLFCVGLTSGMWQVRHGIHGKQAFIFSYILY